jgi:predicted dienelactone hydrolase
MKHAASLILSISLAFASQALAGEAPGLMERNIPAPHHGRIMPLAVWYPATEGATETFAENPICFGGTVRRDAPPSPGKHPLVVLSHGMGGTYLSLNWLASGLAERGAIVVSVNHPNGWFRDRNPKTMFNHWTRVQDLQIALDYVLADREMAGIVDRERIYAAGFSFGGWTALSIGGATADLNGNAAYCKTAGDRASTCTDLEHFGFDPADTDKARWSASYKDPRIKAVVAIEPGLTWGMGANNVRDLDQDKLLVIGLGKGADRMYPTDTSLKGSGFEQLVPRAHVEVIAPATHFTAMPVCKPTGAVILAEEKDDPVCTDPSGTDRKAVHDKIIALTAQHFGF